MELGAVLAGRFRLVATLGEGRTFRAHDEQSGGVVAVRIVPTGDGLELAELAAVSHPGLSRILAHGDGFLALEWIDGETLRQRLRGGMSLPSSLAMARVVAGALAALHERGIVHGGVSPSHIVFAEEGVKLVGARLDGARDAREDVRALGDVLDACLAGCPKPPPALVTLVARMRAADPAERPESAAEVAGALAAMEGDLLGPAIARVHDEATMPTVTAPEAGEPAATEPALTTRPRSYEPRAEIARGGMGRVLSAHDARLDRTVAVKQLLPGASATRFAREARLTARLEHPSIVPVYDVGESDGGPFYTMKLVSGRSLSAALASAGSLAGRLALLPNALAVAEGVAYAHSKGIVHRDIKPSNVVIGEFGETLVVDWGLAKDLRRHDEPELGADRASPSRGHDETAFGEIVGTPAYMAPEQATGMPADERADVYSLGGLLFKLLTGAPPHEPSHDSPMIGVRAAVRLDARRQALPPELVAIVHKAMALDPGDRYANAGELADDLRRYTTGQLVAAHHYGWWQLARRWLRRNRAAVAIASVALLIIVAGGVISLQRILRASAVNERLLRESYFEQGRLRALAGDKAGALEPLRTAYRMGQTDAAMRLLIEEAERPARSRVATLRSHTGRVWEVAYSPDGRWLASGGSDGTARIWDAASGNLLAAVPLGRSINSLAFSPDSRLLAIAGGSPTALLSDVPSGRVLARLPLGIDTARHALAFSPDGAVLLAGRSSGPVTLWRVPEGTLLGALPGEGLLIGATFCAGGARVVTWRFTEIEVWDARARTRLASHALPFDLFAAAVSRSGSLIAIGTRSGELTLLRGDLTPIATRAAHDSTVSDIAISPDESLVVTSGAGSPTRLWSASGDARGVLRGHEAGDNRVAFTASGDRIVTIGWDLTARLWSTSPMLLGEMSGHRDAVLGLAVHPDGKRLATGSWDRTVMVWDLARAEEIRPIVPARMAVVPPFVAFDAPGARLAVTTAGELRIVDVETGAVSCVTPAALPISALAWDGPDHVVLVRSGGLEVERWNAGRCALEGTLAHPVPISAMSEDAGGRLVTAAGSGVRVYRDGHLEASFGGYEGILVSVGIDAGEVYAVSTAPDAIVLDALDGRAPRRILRGATYSIASTSFDHEWGRVMAGTLNSALLIWDRASGTLIKKLEASGPLWGLPRSPDGSIFIGAGGMSPALYDRDGAVIRKLDGHASFVRDGAFIDDRIFISAASDLNALVWDLVSGRPILALPDVQYLRVSSDRRAVAFIGATGVRLWRPRIP